jgi:phospholipid-binding lipoprotein MlaA
LLDPATEMRLVKRKEDFGQTLGRWGVGAGPYVVLPLFGPRTLRDSFTLLVDRQFDPDKWVQAGDGRWAVFGLEVVNIRSNLLDATGLIDKIALDRYTFVRDGYLARRRDAVHDGAPPPEPFDDEFKDEGDDPPPK